MKLSTGRLTKSKFIFLIVLLFSFCEKKKAPEVEIVAQVGEFQITVDDFLMSYNFGPSSLKKVGNARQTYLDAMINEALLYHKLDSKKNLNTPFVNKSMRLITQELLTEKVYKEDIYNKISVSDDEIRELAVKMSFSVKAEYIFTKDAKDAKKFLDLLNSGYTFEQAEEKNIKEFGVLSAEFGETGYLTYGEIGEPFNSVLFNLKPGEISEIIPGHGGYYILSVEDIRKNILSENEITQYKSRYHKVIYYKKALAASKEYIKQFMDPKEIVVDGKTFSLLVKNLFPMFNSQEDDQLEQVEPLLPDEMLAAKLVDLLHDYSGETAVRFKSGEWTVDDLLDMMSFRPMQLKSASESEFAGRLRSEIGFMLRDYFVMQEALKRDYDQESEIVKELGQWLQKLVVRQYMDQLMAASVPTVAEAREFFEENYSDRIKFEDVKERAISHLLMLRARDSLEKEVAELSVQIPVKINTDVLNKLDLDEPKYGRLPDVKVFKLGLPYLRLAVATPDEVWGFK